MSDEEKFDDADSKVPKHQDDMKNGKNFDIVKYSRDWGFTLLKTELSYTLRNCGCLREAERRLGES